MHAREERDLRVAVPFVIGFAVAIVLGYWGWSRVIESHPTPDVQLAQHFLGRIYLTLQLFVLHPQGLPKHDPWQLDAARFLAPVALATATVYLLTTAFGARIRHEWLTRGSTHVIVCGAGVHGAHLTAIFVKAGTPVVLVDIDPRALGMQRRLQRRESRLVADAVSANTLRRAGARRAARLVAVTGDDIVNAQIANTVRELSRGEGWHGNPLVLVQIEDPALARFLEDYATKDGSGMGVLVENRGSNGARAKGLEVRTFGANALAAVTLFGGGPLAGTVSRPDADAPLGELEAAGNRHLLLAGDHGLLEAIVVTALRRGRAQRLRAAGLDGRTRPPLRITLVGSSAESYRNSIAKRWQLDPAVVDLRAADVDPRSEPMVLASRLWSELQNDVSHTVVACEDEHASITIAVTLSRVLGRAVKLTRVTTQPENELDRQLETYSEGRVRLAPIKVLSITDLAWGVRAQRMEDVPPSRRLAAALRAEGVAGEQAREMAEQLLGWHDLSLQSDAAPRITPASAPIVAGLLRAARRGGGPAVSVSALVAAGLIPDLSSRGNLRRAAEQLSRDQSADGFTAWCEYARLVPNTAAEAAGLLNLTARVWAADAAGVGPAAGVEGVRATTAPLMLKAAALGAGEALEQLRPDPTIVKDLEASASRRIVIFAGGAARMSEETAQAVGELLGRALHRYDGLILTGGNDVGLCGVVREAAAGNGVPVLGYAPTGRGLEGTWLRRTAAGEFSEGEPVAMWTDILAAARTHGLLPRAVEEVRLVAFPGGAITQAEIVLSRALGAKVAFLDPLQEHAEPLDETLPFGSGGVLTLPNDPMTLRAFLAWPNEPLEEARRIVAARELHAQYRRRAHARHELDDDPALAPWERLSAVFRRSNLAAVDDIPNKLHVVGRRLCLGGERLTLGAAEVELLAEMEHGRYNCERLSSGWELGRTRQVTRLVSPSLTPWRNLEESVKQWDRDAVRAIDNALRKAGWGVELVESPRTATGSESSSWRPSHFASTMRTPPIPHRQNRSISSDLQKWS